MSKKKARYAETFSGGAETELTFGVTWVLNLLGFDVHESVIVIVFMIRSVSDRIFRMRW